MKNVRKNSWCWGENYIQMYQMGYEILAAVDQYGNELDAETKRKLTQRCIMAPRFYRGMLDSFHEARQNMISDQSYRKKPGRVCSPA